MTGPLGQRQFRALLAGRAISMLGSAIAPVAIAFAVLDLTGSAAALGLVLAARSIPEVVFMLVGGVIADRFDRARVLVAANVVASGTQGIGTTLLLTGAASVPALANSRSDQRYGERDRVPCRCGADPAHRAEQDAARPTRCCGSVSMRH
jgi:MFS family permease